MEDLDAEQPSRVVELEQQRARAAERRQRAAA